MTIDPPDRKTSTPNAPRGGDVSRGGPYALWILLALAAAQFAAFGLIWVAFHPVDHTDKAPLSSQLLASTGWYPVGSASAGRIAALPILERMINVNAFRKSTLAIAFAVDFAAYLLALLLMRRWRRSVPTVALLLSTLLIALPLLLLPQILSTDLWSYVMYGRTIVIHHGNPFITPPAAYPTDPFLARVYWKNVTSVYGPAWMMVCAVLTRLAEALGGAPWQYVLCFKGFIFCCHLANIALVAWILRRIRPQRRSLGAMLYAWNPLCLIELAGSGHNDGFMMTLLLLAIAAAVAARRLPAVALLTLAGLAKLPGGIGLPAYSLGTARRSRGRAFATLAVHAIVAILTAVILYAPFWHGLDTLRTTANAPNLRIMYHSPAAGIANFIERRITGAKPKESWQTAPAPGSAHERIRSAVRSASLACFLICLAALSLPSVANLDEWLNRLIWIYVAYLLLAAFQFNPWYGTWLVPLIALARRPSPLLLLSSFSLLLLYLPTPIDFSGVAVLYLWPLVVLVMLHLPAWLMRVSGKPANDPTDTADTQSPIATPATPAGRRLGVVTPLANEADTVDEFIRRVLAQLKPDDRLFCVLDHVSMDRTREAVDSAAALDPRVVLVWAPQNRCVREAYFSGYRAALQAGCQWILEMDGGLSHLPEQIPRFLHAMANGADYAPGSRFCPGGRFSGRLSRLLVSWGGTQLCNLLLGTLMYDMCSGFECFTHAALTHVVQRGVHSRGNFFQTEIRILLRRWRWTEVPITYHGPARSLPGDPILEALRILWSLRGDRPAPPPWIANDYGVAVSERTF
jgi:dolichol-phosphate mannosyltransferase